MKPGMKKMTHTVRISLLLLAGASVVACAPFFGDDSSWQSVLGTHVGQSDLRPSFGYYESAVTAINGRHYALALEYLQAARAQKPYDVRVLTAFGVVYDKLGRFDLSARYYTQAAAVDPRSKIIAADVDYSRRLQGFVEADPAAQVADAVTGPAEGTWRRTEAELPQTAAENMLTIPMGAVEKLASDRQIEIPGEGKLLPEAKLDAPAATKSVSFTGHPLTIVDASGRNDAGKSVRSYLSGMGWTLAKDETAKLPARAPTVIVYEAPAPLKVVFLTGHPLTIVDASGRNYAGKSVRSYLLGMGWTLAKDEATKLPVRAQTVIVYHESMITAAKALARTLSLPMRLTVNNDIQGLQLVLGGDISGTNLAARMRHPPHRQVVMAAANTERRE